MTRRFGAVLGSVAVAPVLAAQSAVVGTIRADSTGRPLAGVEVLIEGTAQRTMTDPRGRFSLGVLPRGRHQLLFRAVGFQPVREAVTVGTLDTVWVNQLLIPATVRLAPIEVTGAAPGPRGLGIEAFEDRRKLGFGRFWDSTLMRRADHRPLANLLQGVPGIILDRPGNGRVAIPYSSRTEREIKCYTRVYLDGVAMGRSGEPVDINEFPVAHLVAMEFYRSSAEVPAEYGGSTGQCGVILLWTRRG